MELKDKELLRLLKHGRAEELAELAEEMKPTYAESFPAFMDQMLKEHHLKRSTVARRSGLSQDYLYKLLRGDKRTTERDYIIAICIAAGLNVAQTQHALRIYGMPMLDRKDLRSNIIYVNIDEGASIDAINDRLEKVRLPILRTSPEMEKAVIAPNAAIEAEKMPEEDQAVFVGELEEISSHVHAEHCGNAPFDFAYWGEIGLEDEQEHQFRVQAYYDPVSSGFTAMTEEQFQANEALRKAVKPGEAEPFEKYQMLEWYETLAEAAVSPFFTWYLELDERTDRKALETLRQVDDTRFCPGGSRIGGRWAGGPMIYMEYFNSLEPGRREYFQIQQEKGKIVFSVTHESIYMRMELGDIYPSIFGKSKDIEYWIRVKSLDDIPEDPQRIRKVFDHMLVLLRGSNSLFNVLRIDADTHPD